MDRMTIYNPERNTYKLFTNIGIMEAVQHLGKLEDENIILRHKLQTCKRIIENAKNFVKENEK